MKKRVVCIGAGTGQAAILSGLMNKDIDLFGLVAVTDNGGHSGVVRKSLNLPQIGDSRSCLVSVASNPLMKDLFSYRFTDGELSGTNLGNLLVAALVQKHGDFLKGVEEAGKLLETKANILPITDCDTQICAELEDGKKIIGEWEIIDRKPQTEIKTLYLQDKAEPNPECIKALKNADLIVIGPGSLRTGIISNLLVDGIPEAIKTSKAKKVYVCNVMTQVGQTDGFDARKHVEEIEKYLGFKVDAVLMNNLVPSKEILSHYKGQNAEFVEPEELEDRECVIKNLLDNSELEGRAGGKGIKAGLHLVRHDPNKIANALIDLL